MERVRRRLKGFDSPPGLPTSRGHPPPAWGDTGGPAKPAPRCPTAGCAATVGRSPSNT
ncbi:hypothetical protein GN316_11820 [Xylophilus sp. Kf1]|nr:hypothetical protein [Xylophilus sp. Kf1]